MVRKIFSSRDLKSAVEGAISTAFADMFTQPLKTEFWCFERSITQKSVCKTVQLAIEKRFLCGPNLTVQRPRRFRN
jgi:hypothetical protein